MTSLFGAIEAGGTKFVCAVGTGPDDLRAELRIPTSTPAATIAAALAFFREQAARGRPIAALGVGSFGPVELDLASPSWGHITSTPKPGWAGTDLAGELGRGLGVPVAFETDVNAAALGEGRWGAAAGLDDFVYVTVGTGIGGGVVAGGRLVHGRQHPEIGHLRVRREHAADPFPGCCPFHRDCLEGLAAGPAIAARWGKPAEELPADHPAWPLEARYLAELAATLALVLSPRKILFGGGVLQQPQLLPLIRQHLPELLAGYLEAPEIAPPALGSRAGLLGALALAEDL